MANVVIIGKGPAGISTALYTTRAGINTTVIGRDLGALQKAHLVENYWGFENPVDAKDMVESSIANAKRLGCNVVSDEVVGIGFNETLEVKTKDNIYKADVVVFATGSTRNNPKIKKLDDFVGRGVSYCAVCDAFFYRNKDVCVIGNGEYAKNEALELLPIVKSVTVITNGIETETTFPEEITVDTRKIDSFEGNEVLENIIFSDGEKLATSGAFIALGTASSSDLARKIGASIDGNKIIVDKNMMTNVPNLYAVGDCIGGLLQIAKAVGDGAIAGTTIVKSLRK